MVNPFGQSLKTDETVDTEVYLPSGNPFGKSKTVSPESPVLSPPSENPFGKTKVDIEPVPEVETELPSEAKTFTDKFIDLFTKTSDKKKSLYEFK